MVEQRETELMDQLLALWRWKWLILIGTLGAVVATTAIALRERARYEASAILVVTPSKISISEKGLVVTPDTFVGIIRSSGLAAQALQRFALDRPPYDLTIHRFLSESVLVKSPKGTTLITLTVTLPEPKIAAEVANFIAQGATELIAQLNQSDAVSSRDYIERERAKASREVETARVALLDFQSTTALQILYSEQKIHVDERNRLAMLLATIATEQVGLRTAIAERSAALKRQDRLMTLRKEVVVDPAMLAELLGRSGGPPGDASRLELRSEEINPIHESLQQQLIGDEIVLAERDSTRHASEQRLKENDRRLVELESSVAKAETTLSELRRRYNVASEAYAFLSRRLNEAVISVAAQATDLKLVDRAVPPETPVGSGVLVKAAVAAVVSVVTLFVLVFFIDYVRQARPRRVDLSVAVSNG
jgi:succinoglycan biosynthesis transport protein ExoP